MTTIHSGPTEVVSTGSVINYSGHPINVIVELPGWQLKLSFVFKNDGGDKQELHAVVNDKQELEFTFSNYNNPLGTGNIGPLKIGTHTGKTLYFSYRIYALNETSDKLMHYTIYKHLGEEK